MLSLALSSGPSGELVNKRELAAILGISQPTLADWIDRHADFPVVERGTNGKEWRFDAAAVAEFIRAKDEEAAREEADRRARLAQLGLPFTDPGDAAAPASTDYTLDDIKRIQLADKLRTERGFLVSVPETRQHLTASIARWNRSLHAVIRQAARDFALPDAIARALDERLAEAQRQFVRELRGGANLFDDDDDARRLA